MNPTGASSNCPLDRRLFRGHRADRGLLALIRPHLRTTACGPDPRHLDTSTWANLSLAQRRLRRHSDRSAGDAGKTSIRPDQEQTRVALWGDSQAEGVCVNDAQKIFAQAQQLSQGEIEVFPLTRSGEDVADWLTQFPAVEKELNIDVHVLLIVDLPDLLTTSEVPVPPPTQADTAQANAAIAAKLPAFVIQARAIF